MDTIRLRKRPRDIFVAARAVSNLDERAALLARECGEDSELLRRVKDLLEEEQQLGTFLDTPAVATPTPRGAGDVPDLAATGTTFGWETVGSQIGRYKLLQEIGEGGCGTIYMAEQEEPVRRRVALKVIKAGMDTKSVIARFEVERQALALMDHSSIAKVFDAGTTESGRPYFVMELVRGVRITEFCDQNNLSMRERLELFIKVCHAIQHAHQKGVIHRDIKPSNILVTLHDGEPQPKVIDFGIAKAIEQRLTDKTLFTAFEQFIGTPAYMSPEQAAMSGLDIDTRSDIYSLGVLLYELLTGRTPFDAKELLASGFDNMRRTIREKEPQRPSTKLMALDMAEAADLLKHRHEKLSSLVNLIRGDLDWIVMKAVSKDRTRRYETANALAMDVQRYLDGQTVTARPPSALYQLEKFVRRNRLLVTASACVVLVLVLGMAASAWQAVRATKAEREEGYLRRVAETGRQKEIRQRQQIEKERLAAWRQAYNSDMNLVPQALQANNYGRVIDLLNRHRPAAHKPEAKGESHPDFRQWEWRYFWDQSQSSAAFALPRQTNTLEALAISSDGRFLASRDRRSTLKLWDLFRRAEINSISGGRFGIGTFAFSHRGDRLAFTMHENPRRTVIKVLALSGGQISSELATGRGVKVVRFSANDDQLLVFGEDESLRAWDFTSREPVLRIAPQGSGPRMPRMFKGGGAAISPDGRRVAVLDGGTIRIVDTETGAELSTVPAFEHGTGSMAFSPNGDLIAIGPLFSEVETDIRLFFAGSGEEAGVLEGHVSWVPDIVFASDGKRLISAGADQTIRIWDVANRQQLVALRGHQSEVNCVVISPDGKTIVSGGKDGTLFGWDASQSQRSKRYEILPSAVFGIQFFPDSQSFLSVNRDNSVAIWDSDRLVERDRLPELGRVERVLVSPDGARLYAGSKDGYIRVLDYATKTVITNVLTGSRSRFPVIPVATTEDGRSLITSGADSELRLWDTATWEFRELAKAARGRPGMFGVEPVLSFSQRMVALRGAENTVDLIDLQTGQTNASFADSWGASGMAFSPGDALLAMSSGEGKVNLWDVASHTVVDVLRGHLLGVHDVAFSPDGARLATASAKNEAVKLWDVTSRSEVATFGGEGALFHSVQFSPDGTLLVAINQQGQAHFWRAPSLEMIAKIEAAHR